MNSTLSFKSKIVAVLAMISTAQCQYINGTAPIAAHGDGCLNLGVSSHFNAMIFGDYTNPSSDVQGRLAVGGNARLASADTGFSAGDQLALTQSCTGEVVTVVGGSLEWLSGRNYFGNVIVGQDATDKFNQQVLENGCSIHTQPNFIDFGAAKQEMIDLSKRLGAMADTAQPTNIQNEKVTLSFGGQNAIEVVSLASDDIGARISDMAIENLRTNALIVFNIRGQSAQLMDTDMTALKGLNVVFNFPEATSLKISGVSVHGSVLAPSADVVDATGEVVGHFIVNSATGPMQVSLKPIPQCPQDSVTSKCVRSSTTTDYGAPPTESITHVPDEQTTTMDYGAPPTESVTESIPEQQTTESVPFEATTDITPTDTPLPTNNGDYGLPPAPTTVTCRRKPTTTIALEEGTSVAASTCTKATPAITTVTCRRRVAATTTALPFDVTETGYGAAPTEEAEQQTETEVMPTTTCTKSTSVPDEATSTSSKCTRSTTTSKCTRSTTKSKCTRTTTADSHATTF